MRLSLLSGITCLISALSSTASASYVGWTLSKGPSAAYTIKVHVTLAIPAAYTLITGAPANIDSLARLVIGDLYEYTGPIFMFPPTANYFQYASEAAQKYVSVGAGLVFPKSQVDLDEVRDMVQAIAQGLSIRNAGQLGGNAARDIEEETVMAQSGLVKRDGKCLKADHLNRYTTNDKEQALNVRGSCFE